MSQAQYVIYRRKVIDLARTLVVKNSAAADAINTGLVESGHQVHVGDPTTWKYYMNLAGRYHPTDKPMQVTSLDTLQSIDFTRESLLEHLATAREYRYGSRFYNELLSRYPEQEMLIQGILAPIEIHTAIAAQDGTILYYNPDLVENNEENLIAELQKWCKGFMTRWNVATYALSDDLYTAAHMAILYLNLPQVILNIRLENCHTRFAHSYHIREFLASHGRLDQYADHLTKRQMLWLYRNARYLHRNAGKRETFNTITQRVLTDRGLPLAEWNMRHNTAEQIDEIYPDVEFVRRPLNFGYNAAGTDTRSVAQLLEAQFPAAKGNPRVAEAAEAETIRLMENSLNNRLKTKVLESSVLDLTDATPFTLSDTLLNHWLYFAATDRYKSVIVVDNPKTGGSLTLTMLDAFIVFLYAYNKAEGQTMERLPKLEAKNVRRMQLPSRVSLLRRGDAQYLTPDVLDAILRDNVVVKNYISTASYHESALQIHSRLLEHRALWATREHMVARGVIESAASRLYQDYPVDLGQGQTYIAWFAERGYDIPTFTELEAGLLSESILAAATGTDLNVSQSLKDVQGAMLRLMAQLSSYSVQFLQSINTDPIRVVDWPAIRVGKGRAKVKDDIRADIADVRPQDFTGRMLASQFIDVSDIGAKFDFRSKARHHDAQDIGLTWKAGSNLRFRIRAPISSIQVLNVIEPVKTGDDIVDESTENYVPVDRTQLSTAFLHTQVADYQVNDHVRETFQERWDAWLSLQPDPDPTARDDIQITILDGLHEPEWHPIDVTDLPGLLIPRLEGIAVTRLPGLLYPDVMLYVTDLPGLIPPDLLLTETELPGLEPPSIEPDPTDPEDPDEPTDPDPPEDPDDPVEPTDPDPDPEPEPEDPPLRAVRWGDVEGYRTEGVTFAGDRRVAIGLPSETYSNVCAEDYVDVSCVVAFEIHFNGAGSVAGIGVMDDTLDIARTELWVGDETSASWWGPTDGVYVQGDLNTAIGMTPMSTFVVMAINPETRACWLRNGNVSEWVGGGDPATGMAPTFFVPGTSSMWVTASLAGGATTNGQSRTITLLSDPDELTFMEPIPGFQLGLTRPDIPHVPPPGEFPEGYVPGTDMVVNLDEDALELWGTDQSIHL